MINKNWKSHWKLVAANKNITARYVVQYCLLKALTAKSNKKLEIAQTLLRRAFTPVTNRTELANGRTAFDTISKHIYMLDLHPKGHIFGLDMTLFMDDEGFANYKDLIRQLWSADMASDEPEYLFIFVRQDISKEQQAVQAAHATFKAGTIYRHADADRTNFVLVGVPTLEELNEVEESFKAKDFYGFVKFTEPELGDTATAIATAPIKEHRKGFLKQYKTLVM
jgi:hypothetical protein